MKRRESEKINFLIFAILSYLHAVENYLVVFVNMLEGISNKINLCKVKKIDWLIV